MAAPRRRANFSWPSVGQAGFPSPALCARLALLLFGPLAGPLRSETAVAKHYLIDGWRTESGLPQNTVTGIAQTPDGYLWVSTFDGVARFDGIRFKTFNAGNTPALGSGRIRFLFQGRQGVLWLTPQEGGLIRLENGKFTPAVLSEPGGVRVANSQVTEDASGTLWLSDEDGGVSRVAEGHLSPVSSNWNMPSGSRLLVTTDTEGGLWAVGDSGLYRLVAGAAGSSAGGQHE